jgi:hypothetical protein
VSLKKQRTGVEHILIIIDEEYFSRFIVHDIIDGVADFLKAQRSIFVFLPFTAGGFHTSC